MKDEFTILTWTFFTELLISPDRLVFRTSTFRRSVLLITQSRVMKWDHPNGTAMLNGVHIIWNTDWMATQTWQQRHIKTQRYIKHQRSWARGADWGDLSPAFMMVSQSSSAVRARELLLLKPNGNLDFPFLGSGKMYSPGGGKAFQKSSYWSSSSQRGNLRYPQRPCLQGHLIDSNGRLSWICMTVTLWSAFSKGEHWTVWIWILQGTGSSRLWADGKYLGLPSDVP